MGSEENSEKLNEKLVMVEKTLIEKSNEIDKILLTSDVEIGQLK